MKLGYSGWIKLQIQDWFICEVQKLDDRIDILDINSADFINNGKGTFSIALGTTCSFKCCLELNLPASICQNNNCINNPKVITTIKKLIDLYLNQNMIKSLTFNGLEVLDNLRLLLWFIYYFRQQSQDNIIIWTGYTEEECKDLIYLIKEKMKWENIIIKFGRYIPNQKFHYDEILGINLVSDNQYSKKIS